MRIHKFDKTFNIQVKVSEWLLSQLYHGEFKVEEWPRTLTEIVKLGMFIIYAQHNSFDNEYIYEMPVIFVRKQYDTSLQRNN